MGIVREVSFSVRKRRFIKKGQWKKSRSFLWDISFFYSGPVFTVYRDGICEIIGHPHTQNVGKLLRRDLKKILVREFSIPEPEALQIIEIVKEEIGHERSSQ